tara:strand:- start:2636 stop:2857 length:222 start_codon:yes stop_codon:yes gene_type:complete
MISNRDINTELGFIIFQHLEFNILKQNTAINKLNSINLEKFKKQDSKLFIVIISLIFLSFILIITSAIKLFKK